ncbi:MAG: hypothetical protein WBA66_02625 [Xanthobacteraceae bacterium]
MHSKQIWCAALLSAAFAWAGTMPAAAQLLGIFQGATQAPAATQPEAAPGKPLALKKYTKRRSRSSRHRKGHHVAKTTADKPSTDKSADKRQVNDDDAAGATRAASADARQNPADNTEAKAAVRPDITSPAASAPVWSAIPSSVANARAELEGGTADRKAAFVPTPTATPAPADPATPPRQPNADTAAAERTAQTTAQVTGNPAAAAGPALASADTAEPVRLMSAMVQSEETASSSDSTWSRTSLIGKIFVAFGGLLMLASAARFYIG